MARNLRAFAEVHFLVSQPVGTVRSVLQLPYLANASHPVDTNLRKRVLKTRFRDDYIYDGIMKQKALGN